MTDVLIRGVPEQVVAALDARASQLGLSRSEFLCRCLAQEAEKNQRVTVEHLTEFAQTFTDLTDRQVMNTAWS